ncbi:MAG: DNA polymerase I, partial [Parcubacteria group bacterium]|nr:DNA polymerase I [Parcubacteria group bacterium]
MKNLNQKKCEVAAYLLEPGKRVYDAEELNLKELEKKLKDAGLWQLFLNVEVPLISVLENIKKTGVKINTKHLGKMSKEFGKDLKKLTEEIHKLAGEEFNINSPKQLKDILFEKLKISTQGIRRTFKTGALSTSARELVKLQDVHPIIKLIVTYR